MTVDELTKCYWCRGYGLLSIYPGIVNGDRVVTICTRCANAYIPDEIKGHYGTPIPLGEETGIERQWREER